MKKKTLSEKKHWNDVWRGIELPMEIKRLKKSHFLNKILDVFDDILPHNSSLSILEIGGAPGQYLAFFAKEFGYKVTGLDYSEIGCKKMKENFDILGINATVYQMDLFSEDIRVSPQFDIVYSLGFIEHFTNLEEVIEKHLDLLKPGGILLIGTPNLLGVNGIVMKHIAPERMSIHNLATMDVSNWNNFKQRYELETLFEGYIGGFEPRAIICEKQAFFSRFLYLFFQGFQIITDNLDFHRSFNSMHWSYYLLGIYRKPE